MSSKIIEVDLLVIGGGPAGLAAGTEAARLGVGVLLVDDKEVLGGQLVKQTHMFFGSKSEGAGKRGILIAKEMVDDYLAAGGRVMNEAMVVGAYDDGLVTVLRADKQYLRIRAKKIIVACGAYENMLAFPGGDLPGVYGAGGFQTLMNMSGVLPGKRVLMVGSGNIGLIVSYQLMQAGGEVVALVEAGAAIGGYRVHADKVKRMGVPVYLSHTVKGVTGTDRVEKAILVGLDENFKEIEGSEFVVDVDAVCLAVGLSPLSEFFFAAGCQMVHMPVLGGWVPFHDSTMRTSNKNIFVAGDGSGIEEASCAMVEGKVAGVVVARDILGVNVDGLLADFNEQLAVLRSGPYGEKARAGKSKMWGVSLPDKQLGSTANIVEPTVGDDMLSGKRVVIECFERIPCNPCEAACPTGAIVIGDDISGLPRLDSSKCTGCGICMMRCPGLAIFMVNMDYSPEKAEVTIPYELMDKPVKGEIWFAYDKEGRFISKVEITAVRSAKSFDKKLLVSFAVAKEYVQSARHVRSQMIDNVVAEKGKLLEGDDPIICRCEDVRRSEIESLIDQGYHSFDEIKRITRTGMGPCQGKTCQRLIQQIIARKTGKGVGEQTPMTVRSPFKPVSFAVLADVKIGGDNNE